jgi:hypothetical protein
MKSNRAKMQFPALKGMVQSSADAPSADYGDDRGGLGIKRISRPARRLIP